MLNLLTKTKPWMVASLIVATSVFGQNTASCPKPAQKASKPCSQPCPQPCPPTQVCSQDPCCPAWPSPVLNAAYNYPARIQTRCSWDLSVDVSFIYWQPIQDNMELGMATTVPGSGGISGNIVNMEFDFKPGFKIGLGGNFAYDNWDTRLEYTWFHNTNSQTATAPVDGYLLSMRGIPTLSGEVEYASISEKWQLHLDRIDLDLGRWQYVGTNLVMRPSFGASADWIRQKMTVQQTRTEETADYATITARSSSWAIGPMVALDMNYNMGWGFRFFGNTEADLLFTKYTRLRTNEAHSESPTVASTDPYSFKQKRVYAIRPHFDLEMGLGWGTYLDCNNWYLDFAAGYEFQVYFDQNMFRHFSDDVGIANSISPNGNLYMQGLTATVRLDF